MSIVRVKICGITSEEAGAYAANAGADAIGLVFFERSSRNIGDLDLARDIALACGPFVTIVGLFVNPEPSQVDQILSQVPLGLLQFHGDESEVFCQSFQRPYIKALRMKPNMDVKSEIERFSSSTGILLDAYRPGVPGGTGDTFDWARVPSKPAKLIVLAGGLTPSNVKSAVDVVQPWAVDVSGGVELSPGVKSPQLVSNFIGNAKSLNLSR